MFLLIFWGNIAFWTYRWNPTHVLPIQHGNQGGIACPRLARHVEITVSQCNCLHFILVRWNLLRAWMRVDFLEQCFIVLQVALHPLGMDRDLPPQALVRQEAGMRPA